MVFAGETEFRGTARFEVRRRLGAGGMGVVYEAFDRERGTLVALKTLKQFDAQGIYRIKNEFRALADLEHENLVRLHELHCENALWFFTMELVEGVSFRLYVRPGEDDSFSPTADTMTCPTAAGTDAYTQETLARFDEPRLRAALAQLARGVAALHAAAKIHRDIKPSNVLVTPQGRAVLLDFGLVTDAKKDLATGDNVVGTALYMAPEQAASKPVGTAADWYSVGCVLYEALTGRAPFGGAPLEVLMDKQRFEPPPPRQLVPDVPRDLDSLCADLLRFDPSARPAGAQILARLGQREASSEVQKAASMTVAPLFVGREAELQKLRVAHADYQGRSGAITIVVEGESGIGKSALVRRFLDGLDRTLVLAGRCYERESVPFKAFDGIVDQLSRHLSLLNQLDAALLLPEDVALAARVFPVLRRVPAIERVPEPEKEIANPHELRSAAFRALRQIIVRLARRQALVFFIDDLQWADADSLTLLVDLVHPPDAPRLLLVATMRTAPAGENPVATALEQVGECRRVGLTGLPPEEASSLVALLAEQASLSGTTDVSAIAREAAGHPLFIRELVQHVASSGAPLPAARLDDVLWARVTRLEEPARRLLEVVAVAGAPISPNLAAEAAGLDGNEKSRFISLLRAAHLLRAAGTHDGAVESYHDRVREAVFSRLDDESRRGHHSRLARAIEITGTGAHDPMLLVRHLEAAGETARAARQAELAARVAREKLAFDQSAELYRAAVRLGHHEAADRRNLLATLGEMLTNAGRLAEAADAYLEASQDADANTRLEWRRRAAQNLLHSGHIDRGFATASTVLEEIGVRLYPTPGSALRSIIWSRLRLRLRGMRWHRREAGDVPARDLIRLDVFNSIATGLGIIDNVRAAAFQSRGLLEALRCGEPLRISRALAAEALFHATAGPRARKHYLPLLETATSLARESQDFYLQSFVAGITAAITYVQGDFKEAVKLGEAADQLIRTRPEVAISGEMDVIRTLWLQALRQRGALRELRQRFDQFNRAAVRLGSRYTEATFSRAFNFLWLAQDAPAQARRELGRVPWTSSVRGYHLQHWYEARAQAEIDLYEMNTDEARRRAVEGFGDVGRALLSRIQTVRAEAEWLRGRLALAAGMLSLAERAARSLARERVSYATAWSHLLRAGVAASRGDRTGAATALRESISVSDAASLLLWAAAARHRLGTLVGVDEGAALRAAAADFMAQEGIRNPTRILAVFAPGFDG